MEIRVTGLQRYIQIRYSAESVLDLVYHGAREWGRNGRHRRSQTTISQDTTRYRNRTTPHRRSLESSIISIPPCSQT